MLAPLLLGVDMVLGIWWSLLMAESEEGKKVSHRTEGD